MTSLTKILILFIAIVIIGDVVDMHPDSNRPDISIDELTERLSRLKVQPVADYTDIATWVMWVLRTRYESPQTSLPVETTTKSVTNQHPVWRKRRQALGKLRGEDYGSNSVVSLARSSSLSNMNSKGINPNMSKIKVNDRILRNLGIEVMNRVRKSVLKNRSRRSAADAKMSSYKNSNSTVMVDPTPTNKGNIALSALPCILSLGLPVALPLQCVKFYFDSLFK